MTTIFPSCISSTTKNVFFNHPKVHPVEIEPALSWLSATSRNGKPPVEVEPIMRELPNAGTPLNNQNNTAIQHTGQQVLNSQESLETNILELLKKDIRMNMVTILLLISNLPRQVTLLGHYQSCYLEGQCDSLQATMRLYFLLLVVVRSVHAAAVLHLV